jgi:hypothetical protein
MTKTISNVSTQDDFTQDELDLFLFELGLIDSVSDHLRDIAEAQRKERALIDAKTEELALMLFDSNIEDCAVVSRGSVFAFYKVTGGKIRARVAVALSIDDEYYVAGENHSYFASIVNKFLDVDSKIEFNSTEGYIAEAKYEFTTVEEIKAFIVKFSSIDNSVVNAMQEELFQLFEECEDDEIAA